MLWVWVASLAGGAIVLLAPMPAAPGVMVVASGWRMDLVAHALLFGWLMLAPHGAEWGRRRRVEVSMALAVVAAGLEAAQGLTGYRTVDLADAAANFGGILLGAWVGRWWGQSQG